MSTRAVCTTLWCARCRAETTHVVLYAGQYLKSISCTVCKSSLLRSQDVLRRTYVHDFPARARDLAWRTVHEARHHPVDFLRQLPKQLVLKPLAISSELYDILSD